MTWLKLGLSLIQLISSLLERAERDKLVADTEAVERAKIIHRINQSLVTASQIPAELQGLNEKELDDYVQAKGWYRD